ncbi:MAG: hypothetical protein OCD76_13595 [Reichenbachiella sp.]
MIAALLKLGSGVALGMLYLYHYQPGDTWMYWQQVQLLMDQPIGDMLVAVMQPIDVSQPVRAIIFYRMVSIVALITQGDYWIVGLYFSCFSFLGASFFCDRVIRFFGILKWPVVISFMLVPSVVFWSSGLMKESLAFGAMCFYVSGMLDLVYGESMKKRMVASVLIGFVLLVMIKYYIAAVLVPLSVIWFFYKKNRRLNERVKLPLLRLLVVSVALILPFYVFLLWLSPNFQVSRFLMILNETHELVLSNTLPLNAVVPLISPEHWYSSIINGVHYSFSGLYRPLFFENTSFPAILSGIENAILFVMSVMALVIAKKENFKKMPAEWLLVALYVGVTALFISYSIPNYGSVARYKVYYIPFLVIPIIYLVQGYLFRKQS